MFYANYLKFFERARTEWLRAIEVGNLPGSSDADGMARVATGVLNGMAVLARAGGDLATLRAMGASVVNGIGKSYELDGELSALVVE